MDWYIEHQEGSAAVAPIRREIAAYLARHADPASDLAAAEVVASELLANALGHTEGPVWVSITWGGARPELSVADLGPGFALPADAPVEPLADDGGRGLLIASALATDLSAQARRGGGSRVSATLPVTRPVQQSHDPPRHHTGVLPRAEEARPAGGFGKEAFLRALVVQLARAVEEQHGPDAAEAAVAQVGADVGGQMEAEYRLARSLVGRLSPEAMGECYVRLKHAIDGGFRVLEATPEQIVLVNDRCPFGDAVRASPALCRMTSSVFGGIAARNSDRSASVVLEERIAVGDPGCRVVVRLDPTTAVPGEHRYGRPEPDASDAPGDAEGAQASARRA